MRNMLAVLGVMAAAVLALPSTAVAQLQLTPIASGLSSPIFVGNAHDGSNRLFIVEQTGVIRVLQPGASTPTVFLDIRSKVLTGGERGLLGLAFHPHYLANGRFFVYYTRPDDGTIVVAEHKVSSNRDVATATETVLLTIPHPTNANHNGGMMLFGQDGYLYIGVGDGGSGDDPPNNSQNVNVLLGKILRIDVDPPTGSATPYVSPISNPFYGSIPGRDEIFAFGLRNPWRFSVDSRTGNLWIGDVGQGAREEVDTPLVNGGNYGWRVYEGLLCTGNDPSLCTAANYIPPVFDYPHTNGRCSITGGYVYRGTRTTMPLGTYIYGDYCSGEIFSWNGTAQSLMLDTAMSISSFGEDEQGELYVVDLGGTIYQIGSAQTQACSYSLSSGSRSIGAAGGPGAVSITAGAGCAWTVANQTPWLHIRSGPHGVAAGIVGYQVDENTTGITRVGVISIAGQAFTVTQQGSQ